MASVIVSVRLRFGGSAAPALVSCARCGRRGAGGDLAALDPRGEVVTVATQPAEGVRHERSHALRSI